MLTITIPDSEVYDPVKEEFVQVKGATLRMEHSLLSISKWEAKWKKPFLVKDPPKTYEESLDYYRCMCIDRNVDPALIRYGFTKDIIDQVNEYTKDQMTATWFNESAAEKARADKQIITSELIYWSMIDSNIPIEFEKWNINRLLVLIKVCNIKREEANAKINGKKRKPSLNSLYSRHNAINEANKARFNTRG